MPKRNFSTLTTQGFGTSKLLPDLQQVDALMARKQWAEARGILEKLSQQYPKNAYVLTELVNVCYELKDLVTYERACEQLLTVDPDNPDAMFGLAGAYLANVHPLLALQTFRQAIDRYPQHEKISDARRLVADLESNIDQLLLEGGLSPEDSLDIAVLHERGQVYLEQGLYKKAKQAEQDVIRLKPDFISAHNNLSLISFMEGNLEEAIAISQQILTLQPDNIHALSNLTRYYCLTGKPEQAQSAAEQLKASQAQGWDPWTKKVEALAYLGDDEGILQVFKLAQASGDLKSSVVGPLFYHIVAVAMERLGQSTNARRQWQQALKRSPGFSLAQENLEDLKQPVSMRHAPWFFTLGNWITEQTINDLKVLLKPTAKSKNEAAIKKAVQRYFTEHPSVVHAIPMLLDRSNPQGREFALRLASLVKTPDMLAALKDFALSQRGPDEMRYQAAMKVSDAGLLPEVMQLWLQGKWQEVSLKTYEFHDEPIITHSRQVTNLLSQAILLLRDQTVESAHEAEQLLQQALSIEPDAPDLLNNLAVAYQLQERLDETKALLQQIVERHPDYIIARAAAANFLLDDEELEAAEALLKPVLSQTRFNFAEFSIFCNVYIRLLVAQQRIDAANSWLKMWEGVDPEHPDIQNWKIKLAVPSLLKKFEAVINYDRSRSRKSKNR